MNPAIAKLGHTTRQVALFALIGLTTPALADLKELTEKNGCAGCHKMDKKIFGPSFKEIATKYKGDAAAPAALVNSVKKGSNNAWGDKRQMPPQEAAPEGEVKQIIALILAL